MPDFILFNFVRVKDNLFFQATVIMPAVTTQTVIWDRSVTVVPVYTDVVVTEGVCLVRSALRVNMCYGRCWSTFKLKLLVQYTCLTVCHLKSGSS